MLSKLPRPLTLLKNSLFVVCCPKIESIKVVTNYTCKACTKKLIIMAGTGMCRCINCSHEYKISCIKEDGFVQKYVALDLKSIDGTVFVSMPEEVVKKSF